MTMSKRSPRARRRDSQRHVPAWLIAEVKEFLEANALGRDNAKTLAQIMADIDLPQSAYQTRLVRRAIKDLIRVEKLPIGSDSGSGYYVCEDTDDLARAEDDVMGRIQHLSRGRVNLRRAFHERHGGQMAFPRDASEMAIAVLADGAEDDDDE